MTELTERQIRFAKTMSASERRALATVSTWQPGWWMDVIRHREMIHRISRQKDSLRGLETELSDLIGLKLVAHSYPESCGKDGAWWITEAGAAVARMVKKYAL